MSGMEQDLDHPLIRYSIRHHVIMFPAFAGAIQRIERLHQRSLASGHPGGLLIAGMSGAGKTTVKQEYVTRFPQMDDGTVKLTPVLDVDTPAGPTVKNFAEAILVALGDLSSHKGSAEDKTQRIYHFLKMCRVELLLIDEFQHFYEHGRRNEVMRVTDWLKNLINKAGIPVVLFGLPQCEHVLRLNPQLARRFSSRYTLRPFGFGNEAEVREFRGVLKIVEQTLPLSSVPVSDYEMAWRFYCATFGLIDYVGKIIDGAVQLAHTRQCSKLDLALYAEAFEEEIWRDAPLGLNPFSPQAKLRILNRHGEPFALMGGGISEETERHDRNAIRQAAGL